MINTKSGALLRGVTTLEIDSAQRSEFPPAEAAAVVALQRGEEVGLETLVALHQERALRVAFAITGDRATAEDVVAEAFLRAYVRIDRFDSTRPFGPWLLRIVTNEAIRVAQRRRRMHELMRVVGRQLPLVADPVAIVEDNEQRRALLAHIQRLGVNERAAITLRYLLDMSERTVADTLGWPLGTLKVRLHRARRRLRKELADERHQFTQSGSSEEVYRGGQ
jgi:RNA polymerase sigma-70 factor, ECF subfamily